jgi:hypothetical protein
MHNSGSDTDLNNFAERIGGGNTVPGLPSFDPNRVVRPFPLGTLYRAEIHGTGPWQPKYRNYKAYSCRQWSRLEADLRNFRDS